MSHQSHAVQQAFLAILPRINRHARIYFRHLKCPEAKDDASAETVAFAWLWFVRLLQQGKHPERFVSAIAAYAARTVRSGRRLCGQEKARDVLSARAQQRCPLSVSPIPDASSLEGNVFDEALHDNTMTPVPDQVSFRLDFPAWLVTLSTRDRKLIRALMSGETTTELACRSGLSAARISQLRREYLNDWRSFCGEEEC
jgi:hypothetical protein